MLKNSGRGAIWIRVLTIFTRRNPPSPKNLLGLVKETKEMYNTGTCAIFLLEENSKWGMCEYCSENSTGKTVNAFFPDKRWQIKIEVPCDYFFTLRINQHRFPHVACTLKASQLFHSFITSMCLYIILVLGWERPGHFAGGFYGGQGLRMEGASEGVIMP